MHWVQSFSVTHIAACWSFYSVFSHYFVNSLRGTNQDKPQDASSFIWYLNQWELKGGFFLPKLLIFGNRQDPGQAQLVCSWWCTITNFHLFYLWPWGQGHKKCCPIPSTSCELCCCKVWSCYIHVFRWMYASTRKYIIWPWVTWIVAKYPLHHVTCALAKLEVATFNGLGGDASTRKYIHLTPFGSRSHKTLSSTLFITWPMHLQSCYTHRYWRWCINKIIHFFDLGSRSHETLPSTLYII